MNRVAYGRTFSHRFRQTTTRSLERKRSTGPNCFSRSTLFEYIETKASCHGFRSTVVERPRSTKLDWRERAVTGRLNSIRKMYSVRYSFRTDINGLIVPFNNRLFFSTRVRFYVRLFRRTNSFSRTKGSGILRLEFRRGVVNF